MLQLKLSSMISQCYQNTARANIFFLSKKKSFSLLLLAKNQCKMRKSEKDKSKFTHDSESLTHFNN